MERREIQLEAIKSWIDNSNKGTLILPTGLGKTKVGCDIAGTQMNLGVIKRVLVVVPNTNLMGQ